MNNRRRYICTDHDFKSKLLVQKERIMQTFKILLTYIIQYRNILNNKFSTQYHCGVIDTVY